MVKIYCDCCGVELDTKEKWYSITIEENDFKELLIPASICLCSNAYAQTDANFPTWLTKNATALIARTN